jgi:hypothetical protein
MQEHEQIDTLTFNSPQNVDAPIIHIDSSVNRGIPTAKVPPLSANTLQRHQGMITLQFVGQTTALVYPAGVYGL